MRTGLNEALQRGHIQTTSDLHSMGCIVNEPSGGDSCDKKEGQVQYDLQAQLTG